MKKKILFLFLAMVVIAVSGCNTYKASPGLVLEKAPANSTNNRIVTFTVKGKGVEPEGALTKGQARLMAERAEIGRASCRERV